MKTTRSIGLRRWVGLATFLLATGVPPTLAADLDQTIRFNIPAGKLSDALIQFSRQSHVQVLSSGDRAARETTAGLSGSYTVRAGLDALLQPSHLKYRATSADTVILESAADSQLSFNLAAGPLDSALEQFRQQSSLTVVAPKELIAGKKAKSVHGTMVPTDALRQLLKASGLTFVRGSDDSITIQAVTAGASTVDAEGPVAADVSVESQHLGLKYDPAANLDIVRTVDDVQPYTIFDSTTIESSGAINVEDFLKQRLTMNTTAQTTAQMTSGSSNAPVANATNLGNTSSINLRGLGTDHTLVLVDGRRVAGVSFQGGPPGQPDVNGIPLSAIDRIEVLPTSASAIYGASALGGVINIILKKNYQGGEVTANYANFTGASAPTRTLGASFGSGFNDGKTHVMVSVQWSDAEPLLLKDREQLLERGIANLNSNDPGFIYSHGAPFIGVLPNVTSTSWCNDVTCFNDPGTLTLKDGTPLNSDVTYVPSGTTATTSLATLSAGLLANAGHWNFTLPPTAQTPDGLYRQLSAVGSTKSITASIRQELTPNLEIGVSGSHAENDSDFGANPAQPTFLLPPTSKYDPFTSAVVVALPLALTQPYQVNSTTDTLSLAITATLPRNWIVEAGVDWSRNRLSDVAPVMDFTGLNVDLGNGTLDPLVDSLAHPLNLAPYLTQGHYSNSSELDAYQVRAAGSLWDLPWGTPTLIAGLERRVSTVPMSTESIAWPYQSQYDNNGTTFATRQSTDSLYAESLVPLVKGDWLPGIHTLELQLSAREERYAATAGTTGYYQYPNDPSLNAYNGTTNNGQPFSSTATYSSLNETIGVKYQPVSDVIVRASIGNAFLPPSPQQLIKNPLPDPCCTTIIDPRTNQTVQVTTISGGNPGLKPQSSKSLNAGVVWEPSWRAVRGLRLDIEYYRIDQYDAISSLGAQQLVDESTIFPGRVTRNAQGQITLVDVSNLNLYKLETEGWDFTVRYPFDTPIGAFDMALSSSIIEHLRSQYDQTLPQVDAINIPAENGAAKLKANVLVNWAYGPWRAGWVVTYFGHYEQFGAAGGPDSQQNFNGAADPEWIVPQGGSWIPSQTYHDVMVGYTFRRTPPGDKSQHLGKNLTVQLGIKNVFNRVPPYDAFYDFYTSPYGQPARNYWLSFRAPF
jgi:iron complex outermembrane recepter protein